MPENEYEYETFIHHDGTEEDRQGKQQDDMPKRKRVIESVISILKALINIIDVISDKMKE